FPSPDICNHQHHLARFSCSLIHPPPRPTPFPYTTLFRSLADRVAASFFSQGKTESLIRWSNELKERSANAPRLAYVCALIHTDRYEYDLAESELDLAESGFEDHHDSDGLVDVRLQRAMLNLQRGQYRRAADQASSVLNHIHGATSQRGRALKVLGMAHLRLG